MSHTSPGKYVAYIVGAILLAGTYLIQPSNIVLFGAAGSPEQQRAGIVLGLIIILAGFAQNQLPRVQDQPPPQGVSRKINTDDEP